ncbi:hypothetical protein HNY73_009208 [Argiope bruennichi]|uniref:Uncharacterized protein n=1 Tax=Argiope bruennichi TaxID=94029 RepID=A0A8T0FEC1_ARGBR|nr:hypothetical protein HNY73_009208 [Argiope bruennichi]
MFAKVVIFCAALAASHASFVGPLGLGAPVLAAGPLGYGKGLIAAPAVATVSSQRTAINHVAPAAPVAAVAPLGYATPIVGGPILAAAPAVATVSTQRTAINHVAPAASVAAIAPLGYAAAPIVLTNGVIAGNGILATGHGLAAPWPLEMVSSVLTTDSVLVDMVLQKPSCK